MTFSWPLPSLLLKLPNNEDDDYFCDDSRYEAGAGSRSDDDKKRQLECKTVSTKNLQLLHDISILSSLQSRYRALGVLNCSVHIVSVFVSHN